VNFEVDSTFLDNLCTSNLNMYHNIGKSLQHVLETFLHKSMYMYMAVHAQMRTYQLKLHQS